MIVGWGQSEMDNYTQEIIYISDEEIVIISNHEMEGYTFSDTTNISVSRLLPPCDDGYNEIDSSCYYQSDLDVLQQFIDNSQEGDNPPPSDLSPIELGEQVWEEGRLVELCCEGLHGGYCQSFDYELSGIIPYSIGNLTNLNKLFLGWNNLLGEIPSEIGNLTQLTTFFLYHNNLNGLIPTSIGNMISLQFLFLNGNHLEGEIPIEITNLINLKSLFLGFNELNGEIPENIGNLTNLYSLDLMNNDLTGNIPYSIGNLSSIQNLTLWLHYNQLGGEIPESICNLINLNWTNNLESGYSTLYNNNLCPPYPDCLVNQEPFTDENDNGIWDEGEPYEDTNENGVYEEDYVGYQEPSECPGEECQLGDYNGYYDCSQTCLVPVYFDDLGDDSCDDSGVDFDCYNYGYDCGDCSEDWDGSDPLGFCNCPLVTGDTNEDGDVNILDIVLVGNCILSGDCDECSDLNYDGSVDVLDIVLMINIVLEI